MQTKLTLEALEVLDAIDKKGSFAAAAAALYRVPSAVTYSVHKLEEDLGVTLFKKEGRRSVLTPAGKVLLTQGRMLLDAAERLVETTRQVSIGWESHLNIAIDSILCFDVIYAHLETFYQLKPDIEINLYEEVLGGAWEAIIKDRVDLVIGAIKPPTHTHGLHYKEIMQVAWTFVVARTHPLTEIDQPLTQADIRKFRAVVIRDSSQQLPTLTQRVFDKQTILRVATMQHKIDAQIKGLGVGFLPRHRIQKQLDNGNLVALPLAEEIPHTPLHLAWKSNNKGKALRWFINRLLKDWE